MFRFLHKYDSAPGLHDVFVKNRKCHHSVSMFVAVHSFRVVTIVRKELRLRVSRPSPIPTGVCRSEATSVGSSFEPLRVALGVGEIGSVERFATIDGDHSVCPNKRARISTAPALSRSVFSS